MRYIHMPSIVMSFYITIDIVYHGQNLPINIQVMLTIRTFNTLNGICHNINKSGEFRLSQ